MAEDNTGPGRPTDYKPEYAQLILDYFGVKPYARSIKSVDYDEQGRPLTVYGDAEAADFPSFAGFAVKIGVHRETLLNWSKDEDGKPEFADAYKRAKDMQENFVIVNGNKGLIASNFAIFTAKNVLGWRDKQPGEADVVVNTTTSLPDEKLDQRIAELERRLGKQ